MNVIKYVDKIARYLSLCCRFIALPSLIQAPRDHERLRLRLPRRRLYEVVPEVMGSRHVMWTPVVRELDFSEDYRRELAIAFANVYLVEENAVVISVMHNIPIRHLQDQIRFQRAQIACNGQDPIVSHLYPLLVQIGHPIM